MSVYLHIASCCTTLLVLCNVSIVCCGIVGHFNNEPLFPHAQLLLLQYIHFAVATGRVTVYSTEQRKFLIDHKAAKFRPLWRAFKFPACRHQRVQASTRVYCQLWCWAGIAVVVSALLKREADLCSNTLFILICCLCRFTDYIQETWNSLFLN